jgi:hypothetical protein
VFLEGCHLDPRLNEAHRQFTRRVLRYTITRLAQGTSSEDYLREKESFIGDMAQITAGRHEPSANEAWQGAILRGQASQDSAIFLADADARIPGSCAEEHAADLRVGLRNAGYTAQRLSARRGALHNLCAAPQDYTSYVDAQYVRETESVNMTTEWLRILLELEGTLAPDLKCSPTDKMQVCTLWGTNHAYSLTQTYARCRPRHYLEYTERTESALYPRDSSNSPVRCTTLCHGGFSG